MDNKELKRGLKRNISEMKVKVFGSGASAMKQSRPEVEGRGKK